MQHHQLLTLHWHSLSGWGRERLSPWLLYKGCQYIRTWQCSTIVIILQLTLGYLNATIKRMTRNAQPEIGTNESSPTQQNPRVDRYRSGIGPPGGSSSGFSTGLKPNRHVCTVRTRTAGGLPGPVANTTHAASHPPTATVWSLHSCCQLYHQACLLTALQSISQLPESWSLCAPLCVPHSQLLLLLSSPSSTVCSPIDCLMILW